MSGIEYWKRIENYQGEQPVPTFLPEDERIVAQDRLTHFYGREAAAICETETKGFDTPENRSPSEIVVDATEGFIPLWDKDVLLRWRFQERSMLAFVDPEAAKRYLRQLFGAGLQEWGAAVPVRFTEVRDGWDFEIAVKPEAKCSPRGCVLASAFFPDAGQHELALYPTLFEQSREEQVETLAHEIGHVFGLRHFFALVSETEFPAEIFGEHQRFSIMNYGSDSKMTENDRSDLQSLYQLARAGALTKINGTPIRLVRPFSALRPAVLIS